MELIAGLGLLFGFYTPLMLLICLPVSFCVFYWNAPLEGWGSRAALFGYATLLCNVRDAKALLLGHANRVAYCDRVTARFFPDYRR